MINDNFGIILASFFRAPSTAIVTVSITEVGAVAKTLQVIGPNSGGTINFNDTSILAVLDQAQVGQGSTAATRSDTNIETPFANGGPEDSRQSSLAGGYNSGLGQITITTIISPATGAGSVTEICKFINWIDQTGATFVFLLFRDIITAESFIATKTITVTNLVQI